MIERIDVPARALREHQLASRKGLTVREGLWIEWCCPPDALRDSSARYRRGIKARGHFPSEQAAMTCLYLVARSPDPTGVGRARWTMRWKPAPNAFAITFGDRFPAAETY
jgi:hypothetical protein